MASSKQKRTFAEITARRACSIALLFVTVPLAAACHPLIPAETESSQLARASASLEELCGGRCVLVDLAGKPLSSCPYGGIAEQTQGFAVLTGGGDKEIVNAEGFVVLSDEYQVLAVHGNGLIEVRAATGRDEASFYNPAGQRVAHFKAEKGSRRLEVQSWSGMPVVTRCTSEHCTATLLGVDGQTVAEFARLDVLDGHAVAAASLDGRHFGLLDGQLGWVGRRDYDEILTGTPLVAKRSGGLTALEADGRELIPLGDYSSVGSIDKRTITAKLSDSSNCVYFTQQGEPLPARSTACLLRGDATMGYYIFGDDASSYIGHDQGEPMSPRMAGLLLPLSRRAIAHIAAGLDGRMGTVSPQGVPQLPHRYSALSAFRSRESGTVFRDDLLIASVAGGTGLMDLEGRWRIEPRYLDVSPVSRTVVYVQGEDGVLQLFNTDGKSIGATHFIHPKREALLDGTYGIVASEKGRMGILDEDGRWRVPPQYQHVTVTRLGGVIVYVNDPSGRDIAYVLNLLTKLPYPTLALDLVHERPDGLLEGYSAAEATRYLFTIHGEILARVPVPVPPRSGLDNRSVVPYSRIGPAPCAFHTHELTP